MAAHAHTRMAAMPRLRRFLDWPWAVHVILGVALILLLPSFALGLQLDDRIHRVMATDSFPMLSRGPTEYYAFFLDADEFRGAAAEVGILPWYTDPGFHGSFWRPLSSLSLHLDHAIVGSPAFAHAHSLAWFAALILATWAVYRRVFEARWLAVLALLLFALDESHANAVGWIAARNSVMSMAFATAAVALHLRWREEGDLSAAFGAPAMLGLGLLSGETALAMTAYLFAYALWLDRGSVRERAASLLPCAAVSVVWRVVYVALGHGFGGSGLYIDPSAEPLHFARAMVERLPALISSQFTPVSADFVALIAKPGLWVLLAVGLALLGMCTALAWPALRERRDLAAFFATGMVLAAVPMCSTMPQERLLFPVGLGGFGLVAIVLQAAFWPETETETETETKPPLRLRAVGAFLVFTHLVLAPLTLPPRVLGIQILGARYDATARSIGGLGEVEGKTVYLVRSADLFTGPLLGPHRAGLGLDRPARTRTLASGVEAMTVARTGPRTLAITCDAGLLDQPLDRMFRDPEALPFVVGERHDFGDGEVLVEVVTPDGRPTQLRFESRLPLEREDALWMVWTGKGYEPFALPEVGERVELAPAPVDFSTDE